MQIGRAVCLVAAAMPMESEPRERWMAKKHRRREQERERRVGEKTQRENRKKNKKTARTCERVREIEVKG